MLIITLLLILLSQIATQEGVQVSWQAFDYMYSGIMQPIIGFSVDNIFSNNYYSPIATYKYEVTFVNKTFTDLTIVNIGILGIQISPQLNKKLYLVNNHDQRKTTGFTYYIRLNNQNYVKTLKISYLCADGKQLKALSLSRILSGDNLDYTNTRTGSGYRQGANFINWTALYTINMSHQNIDISHIKGFQILATSTDKILTMGINEIIMSSVQTRITFWTSSSCELTYLQYYTLFIDKTLIQTNQQYFMDYGTIYGEQNEQKTQINKLELVPRGYIFTTNFFYFNLSSFQTQGFDLDASTKTLKSLNKYSIVNISYFSFKKRGCPDNDPLYYHPKQRCYQLCPTKTFENQLYKFCVDCNFSCASCNNESTCLTCNKQQSFRNKNGNKCECVNGYYQSNEYICGKCIDGCILCTNNTICSNCNTSLGYSKNSDNICVCQQTSFSYEGQCKVCNQFLFGCLSCPDSQTCIQCLNKNYTLDTQNNICKCNVGFIQNNQECQSCSQINGCIICNSIESCTQCQSSFYLINNICVCPNGTYLDITTMTCKKCDLSCLTCNNGTSNSCTTCHFFLIKISQSCKCQKQNYVSNGQSCVECQDLCNSLICTGSLQSSCQSCSCSCQNGFYKALDIPSQTTYKCFQCNVNDLLSSHFSCTCPIKMYIDSSNNNSCISCHYSCLTCLQKSNENCTRCNTSDLRTLNKTTLQCSCNPFYMDAGDNSTLCIKLVCDLGYSINLEGSCAPICGDGLVAPEQQCDDKNTILEDGCTQQCKVQTNWTCSGILTQMSICFYNQPLQLFLESFTKDPNSNNLTYIINIRPNISGLQNLNFSEIINLGLPNNTNFQYFYQNGILKVSAQYFQNLQSIPLNITFIPSNSSFPSFSNTPTTTINYIIQPQNNLAANVYPDEIYNKMNILQYACLGTIALSLLTFLLSLYAGKVIGTQMIWVVQLAFIGLIILDFTDPLYMPMRKLAFSNGYSLKFSDKQTFIPNRVKSLGYYNSLINNFNIMIGLQLIIGILSFIFFIISIISKDDANKIKYRSYSKLLIGQWMITAILLSIYQYTLSVCILLLYPLQQGILLYLSFIEAGIFGISIVAIIVLFGLKSNQTFGQFKSFFKESKIGKYYYFIPVISRLSISICLGIFNDKSFCGFSVIGILTIQLILTLGLRPYSKVKHNARQIINIIAGIIIITCYVIFGNLQIMKSSIISLYIPFAVIGILIITVVMNLSFLIYEIVEKRRKQKLDQAQNLKQKQNQKLQRQHQNQLAIFEQQKRKLKQAQKNSKRVSIFKSKPPRKSSLNSQLLTSRPSLQSQPPTFQIQQLQDSIYPMDKTQGIDLEDIKLSPIGSPQIIPNVSNQPLLKLQQIQQQNIQELNDSKQFIRLSESSCQKGRNSEQINLLQQNIEKQQ